MSADKSDIELLLDNTCSIKKLKKKLKYRPWKIVNDSETLWARAYLYNNFRKCFESARKSEEDRSHRYQHKTIRDLERINKF